MEPREARKELGSPVSPENLASFYELYRLSSSILSACKPAQLHCPPLVPQWTVGITLDAGGAAEYSLASQAGERALTEEEFLEVSYSLFLFFSLSLSGPHARPSLHSHQLRHGKVHRMAAVQVRVCSREFILVQARLALRASI